MTSQFQRGKAAYLEQEDALQRMASSVDFQLHFRSWMDATIHELEVQFTGCETTLAELQQAVRVEEGDYWNARTLSQHCNLAIAEKKLIHTEEKLKEGEHIGWGDLLRLKQTLMGLKKRLPDHEGFLNAVVDELHTQKMIFQPRELSIIAKALEAKLVEEVSSAAALDELGRKEQLYNTLLPQIREAEEVIEDALRQGEVAIAEDVSKHQLDLYEQQLGYVTSQYPVIAQRHTDTEDHKRRRRWHIFRMANKDITCVIEAKLRQIEACQEDEARLDEQIQNYATDDECQKKRYSTDCAESDQYLVANQERQKAVWNTVHGLYQELCACQEELGTLADARRAEVERRLRVEEREAGRRSGHAAFLRVAERHRKRLDDTIANADKCHRMSKALNSFVLDQCETVTQRYDDSQQTLRGRLGKLRDTHFRCFSDYCIKAGRLIDRKEQQLKQQVERTKEQEAMLELRSESLDPEAKRHATNVKDAHTRAGGFTAEIAEVKSRLARHDADIQPTLRAFDQLGIPHVHPSEIVSQVSIIRRSKVADCKDNLARPSNEVVVQQAIESERVDVARTQEVRSAAKVDSELVRIPRVPAAANDDEKKVFHRSAALKEKQQGVLAAEAKGTAPPVTGGEASVGGKPDKLLTTAELDSIPASSPAAEQRRRFRQAADSLPDMRLTQPSASYGTNAAGPSSARAPALTDGCTVRAKFAYGATDSDELNFKKGETFVCVCRGVDDGWYIGVKDSQQGLFPANYVELAQ